MKSQSLELHNLIFVSFAIGIDCCWTFIHQQSFLWTRPMLVIFPYLKKVNWETKFQILMVLFLTRYCSRYQYLNHFVLINENCMVENLKNKSCYRICPVKCGSKILKKGRAGKPMFWVILVKCLCMGFLRKHIICHSHVD